MAEDIKETATPEAVEKTTHNETTDVVESEKSTEQSETPVCPKTEEKISKSTTYATALYAIGLFQLLIPFAVLVVVIGSIVCKTKDLPEMLQGHFANQLKVALIFVVLSIIGMLTAGILVGVPIAIGAVIYYYWKMIKGLIALRNEEAA